MRCKVVYGPPGTGKTSTLLDFVEAEVEQGTAPGRIAFVSFTKSAAEEAVSRASLRLGVQRKSLRHFRTLHSAAFSALGLSRGEMLVDYSEFANAAGIKISKALDEDAAFGENLGDAFLHAHSLCRSVLRPYGAVRLEYGLRTSEHLYERLERQLIDYKAQTKRVEFVDLPDLYIANCDPLDVDVAIIDEAQDLTPQQWRMARHACRRAKRIYIAGDDDQAIYQWAGADALHMLGIEGEQIVLSHSYRLPQLLQRYSQLISGRIEHRKPKQWFGTDAEGELNLHAQWAKIPFDNGESWLVLARNRMFLRGVSTMLEHRGMHFSLNGRQRLSPDENVLIDARFALLRGERVKGVVMRKLLNASDLNSDVFRPTDLVSRDVIRGPMDRLLSRWPQWKRLYAARLRDGINGAIDVTTIHQSKGREADNVVLLPDVSAATWAANGDAEHRTFYVGATRARKRLFILPPTQEYHYQMP